LLLRKSVIQSVIFCVSGQFCVLHMQTQTDAICPLCQEDEETILHLLGKFRALFAKRVNILGSLYLSDEELGKVHWHALLRLANASQQF